MELHINAKVKFVLPIGPGKDTPVVVDAKITAVYQDGFLGIAGATAVPALPLAQRKGKPVSSWVDLETLDGTLYKYVPHAQSFEGFKCWHWAWPVEGETKKPVAVKLKSK